MVNVVKWEHVFMCDEEKVQLSCTLDSTQAREFMGVVYKDAAKEFSNRLGEKDFYWKFSQQTMGWQAEIKEEIFFEVACRGMPRRFLVNLAEALKKRTNLPPCASGDVKTLGKLEEALLTLLYATPVATEERIF